MRVSSRSIQMQWLRVLTQQQADVARLQQQLGSGKRVSRASDDPVGAAQITLFQQGIDRLETYAANADTAERRLRLSESSLNEATDVLTRARELAVQAGGASALAPEARLAIANEVRELVASMVDIANAQDGEGRYLYAGNRVQTRPFEETLGTVVYAGDQGIRSQRISDDRLIQENDSGADVFNAIRNGNGVYRVRTNAANTGAMNFTSASVVDPTAWVPGDYTITFTTDSTYDIVDSEGTAINTGVFYSPGSVIAFNGAIIGFEGEPLAGDEFSVGSSRNQDVFTTLNNFASTLESTVNDGASRAQYQTGLNNALLDLEQSLNNINNVRSDVGARLNVIDDQRAVNEEVGFQLQSSLSKIQDLDYASAISELQLRLVSLEAAQQSFARTQQTSLFNFI
ncbi:MAG: flagellar hook-associated protein FlgL [Gammaproteobacteria bacterium]|nr:flagellar hook-associated protein FlgL [Gammaproteobacteria bacterium]